MANYVVTIRIKDGSLTERDYTANDRAELFKKLATDGVTAICVREGQVRRSEGWKKTSYKASKKLLFLLFFIFVAVCVICWVRYVFLKDESKAVKKNSTTEIQCQPKQEAQKALPKKEVTQHTRKKTISNEIQVSTNQVEQKKTIYELRPDIDWDAMTNRTFSSGVEQLLSWICRAVPGEMMMPLPPLIDEEKKDIAAILISRNEIKVTDSDDIVIAKEDVSFAKKELTKFIKDGGSPDEFFAYYDDVLKKAYQKRKSYVEELQAMQSDEEDVPTAEELKMMVERINKELEDEGIKPIIFNDENNSVF